MAITAGDSYPTVDLKPVFLPGSCTWSFGNHAGTLSGMFDRKPQR